MATSISESSEDYRPRGVVTHSPEDTMELGRRLGAILRVGDCVGLKGGLGAGKTTFTKGIVMGAGGDLDVRSPTFLLHAVHRGRITVNHLDLYRLPAGGDPRMLGLDELLEEGAAIVEWPERTGPEWFTAMVEVVILGDSDRELRLRLPAHLRPALDG